MRKCSIALACAFAVLMAVGGEWVADPYRAVDITWKKHPVKGKDFWLLFNSEMVLNRPGVSELPMVRESGTQWVNCDTSPLVQRFYRTITLHSVQGLGPDGKEVPVTFTVTCDDPKAVVWTADNGATVVSGPIGDTRVRYLPIAAKLSVRSEKPLSKIVLKHGTGLGGQVDSFSDFSAAATYAIGKDRAEIVLEKSASALTCALASAPYSARILGLAQEQKLAERLANAPFSVYNRMSIWGMLNLPPHAVDKTELRRIAERYPETFLGVEQTEWDANFLQKLIHGPTDSYLADLMVGMKIPCTRDEMIRNLYRQWDNYGMMNGSRRFGMSGGLNFQHFGLDAGGTIACYEITDSVGAAARLSNRTNFSAARQFGTPSQIYMAYFAGACHADSSPRSAANPHCGEDFGVAPSYGLRNFYLCYYMGINYLEFESQPWAQTKYAPDGKTFVLTKNGEAIQDIFNWSKRPEGARGDWYAPILLLKDRRNADDGKYAKSFQPFSFYSLFPATEGDAYADMIDRTISPASSHNAFDDPAEGTDMVNSDLADIFCHYMADPVNHGEVTYEDLAKYPVVIVAGDFAWTETLANTAKKYVAGGGTLVLTAAQAAPFDALFLGYAAAEGTEVSDGLVLQKGRVASTGRTLVETKDKKLPLVVRSRYGEGHVLYVTAPNFRRPEAAVAKKYAPPPQLKDLLLALQDEVVPVRFSGACNVVYNHLPDGTWKMLLINHNGVAKKPNETEEHFFPEYAKDVVITLPKGATAKEVRYGAEVKAKGEGEQRTATLTLPPAGIFVVEVKGAKFAAKPVVKNPKFNGVYDFVRRGASSGVKDDGFRFDPAARQPKEKAPAVIGEWLARNRFKDSSGNGHDLALTGPIEFKGDVAVFKGGKPMTFGHVNHFEAPYVVKEGTFETWVRPETAEGKGAGGVFAFDGDRIRVTAGAKGWTLTTHGEYRRVDVWGPKVENRWTHVLVTFRDEILRFYVDGVEVRSENGPMRRQLSNPEGRNTFYRTISMSYGTDQVSWGEFFRGEAKGIRYTSKYTTAEQAKALAARRW